MKNPKAIKPTSDNIAQKIVPFLWFNDNAESAVSFYTSIFRNSRISGIAKYTDGARMPEGSIMTITFRLEGLEFGALNGGPLSNFTPAVSFMVGCKTPKEANKLWKMLMTGGTPLMNIGRYHFSERYGWLVDKYGISWQIFTGNYHQKIIPALMFGGSQRGNAKEAMDFYISVFKNSKITRLELYEKGEENEGNVQYATFKLENQDFIAMDSNNDDQITFTEANSFVVYCNTQEEIDYYWEKLSKGGSSGECGWLTDKFGVSWQIVPRIIGELMNESDPIKSKRVMDVLLKMKKLNLKKLEQVYMQEE
jgi:predicted 3-demethylubiquinone-9 3-methyltransferase (glyoxalase superfamily)